MKIMSQKNYKGKESSLRPPLRNFFSKIETFIEIVGFENKSNFDKITEYLSYILEKQSELKLVNSQIQELIAESTIFENEMQT